MLYWNSIISSFCRQLNVKNKFFKKERWNGHEFLLLNP